MQSIDQDEFGYDHACSLEVNCLPAVIAQVLNFEHERVGILGEL